MDGNSLYISIFLESSLKPVNVDGKKGLWFYKKKSTLNNKQKTQQHCFLKKRHRLSQLWFFGGLLLLSGV